MASLNCSVPLLSIVVVPVSVGDAEEILPSISACSKIKFESTSECVSADPLADVEPGSVATVVDLSFKFAIVSTPS